MDDIKLMTAIIAFVCIAEVAKTVLWWVVCGTCKLLLRRLTPGEWLRKTLTGMVVCALVVGAAFTLGLAELPPTGTVSWLLLAGTALSLWVAVRELTTLFGLVSGDWNPKTGRLRFFTGARLKIPRNKSKKRDDRSWVERTYGDWGWYIYDCHWMQQSYK